MKYLEFTYEPRSVILYGSYSRGEQDETSDIDCMVITDHKSREHDSSLIDGVQLDCYIYTPAETETMDPDVFLPVYDSVILKDDGTGERLKERVKTYVKDHAKAPESEKRFVAGWIDKTLRRLRKGDDEGCFRGISFLAESLEDYCMFRDIFYFGSRKTIAMLKEKDPKGYKLFHKAVTGRKNGDIAAWAMHVMRDETGE
ncbi:MAG: nucleotidyltransferase domain-containing protein [Lachnospiraceae bacterium]|nr:nucleotidyltransferase domain-containing protein [Lachnospiraceae bacterium]